MTVKEELHRLVEDLPEEKVGQARDYLNFLGGGETPEDIVPEEKAGRPGQRISALGKFAHHEFDRLVPHGICPIWFIR